jgi:dCMP deaminase
MRYLDLARHVASWSKDPSTQVGAVLVGADRHKIALGYNGFPPGIRDDSERLIDKETKYALTQHAERNALDNADFDTRGGMLAVTMFPCHECTKSIISKGIRRVVCPPIPDREPWRSSSKWTVEMFEEASVELVIYAVTSSEYRSSVQDASL